MLEWLKINFSCSNIFCINIEHRVPFSNGYTEGVNNKIKVIKRNAFGVRDFKRFRNRILHVMS
jgi:hypothetical protein